MHVPNVMPPTPVVPRMQQERPVVNPVRPSYMPTTMLPGFFVTSEADIRASDIPNDGSISVFPYRDLSRIVVKQWNGPSTLESAVYVLEGTQSQQTQQTQQTALPPPPPPVQTSAQNNQSPDMQHTVQKQDNAILEQLKQLNNGLAGAFGSLQATLDGFNTNLAQLNSRFIDGDTVG